MRHSVSRARDPISNCRGHLCLTPRFAQGEHCGTGTIPESPMNGTKHASSTSSNKYSGQGHMPWDGVLCALSALLR